MDNPTILSITLLNDEEVPVALVERDEVSPQEVEFKLLDGDNLDERLDDILISGLQYFDLTHFSAFIEVLDKDNNFYDFLFDTETDGELKLTPVSKDINRYVYFNRYCYNKLASRYKM